MLPSGCGALVRLNRENGDAYCGRGYARALLGQFKEAAADAEAALRHGPQVPELVFNAACVLAKAAAGAGADAQAPDRQALAGAYRDRCLAVLGRALELAHWTGARLVMKKEEHDDHNHGPAFIARRYYRRTRQYSARSG